MADPMTMIESEVTAPPSTSDVLSGLTADQRQNWKITGKLPEAAPKKASEASATSDAPKETEPATSEPEVEAKPAPEASTKQEKPPEQKISGAEKRIKQLLGRIKELEAEQAADVRPVAPKVEEKPAATAAATVPKPAVTDLKADGSPKYATYEDFLDARDVWNETRTQERIESALKADRERMTQEQKNAEIAKQNETISKTWNKRVAEATKRHPDFNEVALSKDFMDRLPSGSIPDAFVLESEYGTEVLYHLATQDGELERILALPPIAQARELVKLELQFAPASTSPAPKVTTSAPKPPTELVAKGIPPADEAEAAGARGDFTTYKNVANARELASRKG